MSYRDRSQGIAFIYANPVHLMKSFGIPTGSATSVRVDARPSITSQVDERTKGIEEAMTRLKSNLSRLEDMQSKIRFMISELEKSSRPK